MSKIIKGYKGFGKNLTCKGFVFEVGKEYKHDGELKLCEKGFHFCENPLDILNYYNLCDSEFAEVETDGKTEKSKEKNTDTKICADKIKINAKLDLPMFIKASFDFLYKKCSKKKNNSAASGYNSRLAASGDYSQLAASGDNSQLAASGDYSQLAASGHNSRLAASGFNSQLAASGDNNQLAASGDYSQLAASGYNSRLAASGFNSQLEMTGQNSVGANIGVKGVIKGKKGSWITLAEYASNNIPISVKSVQVDGKEIKEDIWYQLVNGKFTELNK